LLIFEPVFPRQGLFFMEVANIAEISRERRT
jgi:hypothetical protein